MESLRWVQMSEAERDAFLGNGGTGVISFATETGEPPFTIPVSYGYHEGVGDFYFRLSFPPDSNKEAVVDRPIAFVTFDETDDGWRSIVATGELEEVTDAPYESVAVQGMWAVRIPLVDVFDRPPEELTFRNFRLDPETFTGRKEVDASSE
ncbi:pyridoxamine 5'-phosphate oxidase family protein [Halomicrococcus sp. SG-WS-1]|uniref:pyridoxamine 5'-phosphate oxidase family protein n=1 Tax=Halomicrococcus sp. SG-WS-1 TaxID=3439057 RepID=UPI003F79B8A6